MSVKSASRDATRSLLPRLEILQGDRAASCGNTGSVNNKLFRLIDLMTMSADDYLSEWFERSEIKAVLAYYSGIGTFAGPKSPGSAYVVHAPPDGRACRRWRLGFHPRRHGGDHSSHLPNRVSREGPRLSRRIAKSPRLTPANGRVSGVTLADGTRYEGGHRRKQRFCQTHFPQVSRQGRRLPLEFVRDIESYRTFSTAFKINIACERSAAIQGV